MSKVYVELMGQDHEALRFRMLLSDGLSKGGFVVVNDASKADVVLATTLSVNQRRQREHGVGLDQGGGRHRQPHHEINRPVGS